MNTITIIVITLIVGLAAGYAARIVIALTKRKSLEIKQKEAELAAKEEARAITERAEAKAEKLIEEAKVEAKEREIEANKTKEYLISREALLDKRQTDLENEAEQVKTKMEEVRTLKETADTLIAERREKLEAVAEMNTEQAVEKLLDQVKEECDEDLAVRTRKLEQVGREKLERRAQDILVTVMQRLASSTASDLTTTTVNLPNDDIKGKIIGKEGRNIRSFERVAGVELIIDDTPGTVVISSFDPVRRQVARVALENLILDGRMQPAKIEEFVSAAQAEINNIIKEKGESAVNELGIYNLDPRIISILGRLYFRTSYGQNVLQHSIEMAHLAAMLAEEIGADVQIAKIGALVHDIGKALDHEVQGTHIEIGIRILEKFGADPRIVTAMKSHHDDYPHETVEAVIVQTCDMISGSRPGARRDSLENYIKRLKELEAVAVGFEGVDKAYALSAGREIRIFVEADSVSDFDTRELARNVAKKIESDLTYPGEIKVTCIRENRVIEYAR